ncbi:MAG: hypothetical protein QG577_1587 [Thermodesulfobacteriota bacterium]|nr:hypothetical protein [Thermodesulfobacteriota bacterium]
MFTKVSWVEDLREELGVEGISQVWGDDPEYYVWIADTPGIHHIKLEWVEHDTSHPALIRGLFSIRCYPLIGSTLVGSFSREEQRIVSGSLFDDTNTPRYESRDAIPGECFAVGTMEILQDVRGSTTMFVLESLDRFVTKSLHGIAHTPESSTSNESDQLSTVLRDVPGWSLSHSLFDRLVSMFAYSSGIQPSRVVLVDSPGFEYWSAADNTNWHTVASDCVAAHALIVAFSDHQGDGETVKSFIADLKADQTRTIVLDARFPHHACHDSGCEHAHHAVVNPQWWSIPLGRYRSNLTSTCGCEEH